MILSQNFPEVNFKLISGISFLCGFTELPEPIYRATHNLKRKTPVQIWNEHITHLLNGLAWEPAKWQGSFQEQWRAECSVVRPGRHIRAFSE